MSKSYNPELFNQIKTTIVQLLLKKFQVIHDVDNKLFDIKYLLISRYGFSVEQAEAFISTATNGNFEKLQSEWASEEMKDIKEPEAQTQPVFLQHIDASKLKADND